MQRAQFKNIACKLGLGSEEPRVPVEALQWSRIVSETTGNINTVWNPSVQKWQEYESFTGIYKHKFHVALGALGKHSPRSSTVKTIAQNYNIKTWKRTQITFMTVVSLQMLNL